MNVGEKSEAFGKVGKERGGTREVKFYEYWRQMIERVQLCLVEGEKGGNETISTASGSGEKDEGGMGGNQRGLGWTYHFKSTSQALFIDLYLIQIVLQKG